MRPEENIRSPEVGVTGSCEPLDMGAKNLRIECVPFGRAGSTLDHLLSHCSSSLHGISLLSLTSRYLCLYASECSDI